MILGMMHLGLILLALYPLFWLLVFVGWVIPMIKAFQGQMFKLPFIGDLAAKQAGV